MKVKDFQAENEHCLKLNPASANWVSFLKLVTKKPGLSYQLGLSDKLMLN